MRQLTEEEAIVFAEAELWKSWDNKKIASFQLYQNRLCMPFSVFHLAIEEALGRPVWTHEFALPESLRAEFKGELPTQTFADILHKLTEIRGGK